MKNYAELYEWFRRDIIKPAVIQNGEKTDLYIRVPYDDDFDFIYYQDNYNGQQLTPTKLSYAGIYNKMNGLIYDAQHPLRGKLPEIDAGKSMIDLYLDFDKDVCAYIEELVDSNIDELQMRPFTDVRNLQRLDDFKMHYASTTANEMFLNGELCEELSYQCDFSIERKDPVLILRYLRYPSASVENAATAYWLNNKDDILLELRKNDIIREKYREIEANHDNPLHKQRAVIEAVRDTGAKTVNVTVNKDGEEYSFKYSAERLCRYSSSDYGTYEMSAKDRQGFEELFGKYSCFRPEDITSISYRGKMLYDADTFLPDEAEDIEIENDESEDEDDGFTMSM